MEIPTYRRAPNFSIPPNGPLKLGTIVEDLKELLPLNQSKQVDIPAGNTYYTKDKGFSITFEKIREHELGAVARIFGLESLGEIGTKYQRNAETAVYIRELETSHFYPSVEYIGASLALGDVKTYMEVTKKRYPVYMITGLKIAHGASWSLSRDSSVGATLEVTVPEPTTVVAAGPKLSSTVSSKKTTSVEEADSFVLAYRATKIWYKWYNKSETKSRSYLAGATMAGDGVPMARQDGEYQIARDVGIETEDTENAKTAANIEGNTKDAARRGNAKYGEDVVLVKKCVAGIEPSKWIIPRYKESAP
ncbi:uncharacterized protein F4822DRAFT_417329 [Hypoxylon trugodes]|uniref:uncharacterized protein n=1 Tax=Hypoxylon trugodes TaxID=326681 RepID=UPI00219DBE9D|nr:uncharacterized protein F4822DRAFT_417329 [Hypoxylon trugodes]KAI1385109.1 hypothetical protein F4822DRAFT_417329 [Hypoxylon trugodes]